MFRLRLLSYFIFFFFYINVFQNIQTILENVKLKKKHVKFKNGWFGNIHDFCTFDIYFFLHFFLPIFFLFFYIQVFTDFSNYARKFVNLKNMLSLIIVDYYIVDFEILIIYILTEFTF